LAPVLAGAAIGECITCHSAETKRIVELTTCQRSGVGGDLGTMELEFQAAVEIKPQGTIG
jgi:hypothetical protein